MTSESSEAVSSRKATSELPTPKPTQCGSYTSIILQGTFDSIAARKEFLQTITSYGIALLGSQKLSLQPPANDDLSLMRKLSRALAGLWTRKSGVEAQS